MSAERASSPGQVPQPAATPEALRSALAIVAPVRLPAFDQERIAATDAARAAVSAAPLRRFVEQWAVYVAIERHPDRAARLRELEARAATVDDLDEARRVAAEVGAILATAAIEAGLDRGEDGT
ncbi:hypothetical protein C8250_024715 [Streptomyces sp. So13.3]|uniref:hypothetical protein n=1 Tax=Streptomyces TaxID=1883 RepID=UPI00110619F4|nr:MULTISPECIES: hypothetical protein [Streptomyces]QNA74668.1 hypothetical protein C8250_024715 [Streptomyces sp. So13.3]